MCQTIAEVVRDWLAENLCLAFQTAESAGVYDAIAVSLKLGSVWMGGLRIAPAPQFLNRKSKPG
jgi:hypothetical protein